jgi:hypothetical protein
MVDRAQTRVKDGIAWRIGSRAGVEWMRDLTGNRRRISGAIPPVFADYATLLHPGEPDTPRELRLERRQDLALVDVLRRHAAQLPWWLGYLDTGERHRLLGRAHRDALHGLALRARACRA